MADFRSATRVSYNLSGSRVGRYMVHDQLGAGGMGVVYRAHDQRLQRDVALKFLPPGLLADDSARERFRREALALSRLNHPNIETVYDFDTHEGLDFLVIELIPGRSLDEVLASGPLPEAEVLRIGEQMAQGLAAAHRQGVLHRDIKPGNLRVTPEGRLKILDFGVAALLDVQTRETATLPSFGADISTPAVMATSNTIGAVGTLPYVAPEQLAGQPVDQRADIYSAGVVLYEMSTGRRPFPATEVADLIRSVLRDPPPRPAKLARISPQLENLILTCISKNPAARPQSAHKLLEAVQRVAAKSSKRRSQKIDSLAVLPFAYAGPHPELDYLSDGLTESVIHVLSGQPNLKKVIARNSVFRFKGHDTSLRAIASELDVRALLVGRVAQRGDKVTISAELLDGWDERHIWGEQYERTVGEMAGVQRDIADDIAEKLRLKLGRARRRPARPATDPEAFRLYLQGRYFWNKRPAQGVVQKAIEFFEKATERDPGFALAYAGIADCYNTLGAWEAGALAPQIAFPQAKAAAQRALRLDDSLSEAHTALAYNALHFDRDAPRCEEAFRRAFKLNANYVHAHHWYAHYLVAAGRFDEALTESLRIIQLDPLDLIINVHLAWHYCMAHQFPAALEAANKTLEMEPNFHWAYFFRGWAHEQMGETVRAVEALEKSTALSGGSTVMKAALGHAYATAGKFDAARQVLMDLKALARERYVSAYELGLINLALDDARTGFDYLERAYNERSGWLPYLHAEPRLVRFHSDAHFQRLLQRVGLCPAHPEDKPH